MARNSFPIFITCAVFFTVYAQASPLLLPYSVRTRPYSGYSTGVLGDDENIGMAGATVALPTSISSMDTNPAGLTMTMQSISAQINSNTIEDSSVTGSNENSIGSNQWGLAVTPNDWGFAFSYYSPYFEGGNYISPITAQSNSYEVAIHELRFSVSRCLFKKKLSIGASIDLDMASRNLGSGSDPADGLSFKLGAIYRLQEHFLVAASFSPPRSIGNSIPTSESTILPGFAQPVLMPMFFTLGGGWIPNRFLKAGISVTGVGTTANTALLRDQNVTVGQSFTLQPRIGGSYVIASNDRR